MGMFDGFYDEDSECPKCHAKIKEDWQTKGLYSLMEYWRKGDWVQYRKLKAIPEGERKRKYGDRKFAPLLRTSKEYLSDAPLLFNGKVPVHTYCRNCNAWLEAYARVLDGRFVGIIEAEADAKPKEFVLVKTETTPRCSERTSTESCPNSRNPAITRRLSGWTTSGLLPILPDRAGFASDVKR